jgi:hypothetical protein
LKEDLISGIFGAEFEIYHPMAKAAGFSFVNPFAAEGI